MFNTDYEQSRREWKKAYKLKLRCKACGNAGNSIHHTKPKTRFSLQSGPTIRLCKPCHRFLHLYLSNNNLRKKTYKEQIKILTG